MNEVQFWASVEKQPGGCWIWTRAKDPLGYGRVRWEGSARLAHRIAYRLIKGDPPMGMDLDHLCRNHSCVNPEHLEPVSHQVNCKRGNTGKHYADKTHCPSGHPYEGNNIRWYQGRRYCRACHNAYTLARYHARKNAGVRP